jgi:hypothetical protein
VNTASDPGFVGKYTKADAGQQKFGGWSIEGLKRFKELTKLNKEARARPGTKQLEMTVLAALRADQGIEGGSWEAYKKHLHGDKAVATEHEQVDDLFDMDEVGEQAGV